MAYSREMSQDNSLAIQFPWWVVRKRGFPVMLECNFADSAYPNTKFGVVLNGVNSAVSPDTTNLRWGGTGSAKLLTSSSNLAGAEIKASIVAMARPGDLLAFEAKWANAFAQGTTEFQLGIEARSHSQIKQARVSWTNFTGKWQYESSADVYSDFSQIKDPTTGLFYPSCTIENPAVNLSAGTPVSWARLIIDPFRGTYYSFEAPYVNLATGVGYSKVFDMRAIPLCVNGSASRVLYLPFAYAIAHTANAEAAYTTDWCMSIIPSPTNLYSGVHLA